MKLINKTTDVKLLSYNENTKEIYNTHTLVTNAIMQFNDLDVVIKTMQEGTSKDKVIVVFDNDNDLEQYINDNNLIKK